MNIRLYAIIFVIVFSLTLIATAGIAALRLALIDGESLAETARTKLAAATGRAVAMDGARLMRFKPGQAPALAIETLRLPAAGERDRPLAVLRNVRVRFAWADMLVAGRGAPRGITVGEAQLNLAWGQTGRASWAAPSGSPAPNAVDGMPPATVTTLETGTIRVAPPGQAATRIALQRLRLAAGRPGLSGESLWRLAAELGGDGTPRRDLQLGFAQLDQLFAGEPGRLEAEWKGPAGRLQLFGTAGGLDTAPGNAAFDGEISLQGDNLASAWPWAAPPASALPETGFRLSGRLDKEGRAIGFSELALRAGGAELIGRGDLRWPAPGDRTAALSGEVFADSLDLAAVNGRWRDFWQGVAETRHTLDLALRVGRLWADALGVAGESRAELTQTGDQPLRLHFTSDTPQTLLPRARRPMGALGQGSDDAPPTPAPPPASDTTTRHWRDALAPLRAGLDAPSCLAGEIRFRAGTGFLHAVLDGRDGRRIASGEIKRAGPDLTVKQRRTGATDGPASASWHLGGSWARPRRSRVATADGTGPAGGLAVPQGDDCRAGLSELVPAGAAPPD